MTLINYAFKIKPSSRIRKYGYRISKTDFSIEYIHDAVGMTPAHMDFETGQFDYGEWANVWFVRGNKPCMLKYDGTVDYYLNPDDYALKEDGTSSDISNANYEGNGMAQFPLCWVYRYEDEGYYYEVISNVQWDENYKAYAHTNADGNIKDYFYNAIYTGTKLNSKIRSISGTGAFYYNEFRNIYNFAVANGYNWYTVTWAQHSLLLTLCRLITKSLNIRNSIGNAGSNFPTGQSNTHGQFFGTNNSSIPIKIFHTEVIATYSLVAGLLSNNNTCYVKMTPPFSITSTSGYTNVGDIPLSSINDWTTRNFQTATCNEYGFIPRTLTNSSDGGLYIPFMKSEKSFLTLTSEVNLALFSFTMMYTDVAVKNSMFTARLSYV